MCDTVAGELILCFSRMDVAAQSLVSLLREGKVEHVKYADSLENKLGTLDLKPDPELDFEFHLVRVPSGQESWKTTHLQFFYKHEMLKAIASFPKLFTGPLIRRSDYQFTVSPNHLLSLAGSPSAVAPVSAKNFQFGSNHSYYQKAIGLPLASPSKPAKIRVLLLDSGVAVDAPIAVKDRRNIVDPKNPHTPDDHGHGTAVALLIHDLAPNAEFTVYKVADSTGRISEWDALTGIAAKSDAHVVNLSLQFGLLDKPKGCVVCGRESRASRSAIFEDIVGQLAKRTPRPVVIAAAGNYQDKELAYPARFADVLAIGSVTSRRVLTSDCNTGDKDQAGDPHRNHFVLPGGEGDPAKREAVMTSSGGKSWSGSSFAAAFASGLVAELLNRQGLQSFDFGAFVDGLRRGADKNLPHYSTAEHGNGLMRA
jgi:Subtilase family